MRLRCKRPWFPQRSLRRLHPHDQKRSELRHSFIALDPEDQSVRAGNRIRHDFADAAIFRFSRIAESKAIVG